MRGRRGVRLGKDPRFVVGMVTFVNGFAEGFQGGQHPSIARQLLKRRYAYAHLHLLLRLIQESSPLSDFQFVHTPAHSTLLDRKYTILKVLQIGI